MPSLTVAVCTRDRADVLRRFALTSLCEQSLPPSQVVVVDQSVDHRTRQAVRAMAKCFAWLTYVKQDPGRSLAASRNRAVAVAQTDVVAFLDDDARAQADWAAEILRAHGAHPDAACVGGRSWVGDSDRIFEKDGLVFGCNMSFRREVFGRYAFDEHLHYRGCSWFDETDLINRLVYDGWEVVFHPSAQVRHYPQPAAYRARALLGGPLNYLYMRAKRSPYREYLASVVRFVLRGQSVEDVHPNDPANRSWGFCEAGRLLRGDSIPTAWGKARLLFDVTLRVPLEAASGRRRERRAGLRPVRSGVGGARSVSHGGR